MVMLTAWTIALFNVVMVLYLLAMLAGAVTVIVGGLWQPK